MSKQQSSDDVRRALNRSESLVRQMQSELEDTRFRLGALEAWILDKEHAGMVVRALIQNVNSQKFFSRGGEWVHERESAYNLASAHNAYHHCRKERMHNVRVLLEVQRASGIALVPVELPGLRD